MSDSFDQLIRPAAAGGGGRARTTKPVGFPWRTLLAILVPLVVVVGGVAAADVWARSSISGPIREALAEGFHVSPDDVAVDLGGDLAIIQLVNGSLPRVTAAIPAVEVAGAEAQAEIELRGVPVDRALPAAGFNAELRFAPEALSTIITEVTGLTPDGIEPAERDVRFDTVLDLGIVGQFPVTLEFRPSAGPGSVSFSPVAIELGDSRVDAADIRSVPVLGEFIAPEISAREYCVADRFPMGLQVQRFAVEDGSVVLGLSGGGVVVDETLARPGMCP